MMDRYAGMDAGAIARIEYGCNSGHSAVVGDWW